MNTVKQAVVRVDLETLAEILKLPPGTRIIAAYDAVRSDVPRNELLLKIEGDGLPQKCQTVRGAALVELEPKYEGVWTSRFAGWEL